MELKQYYHLRRKDARAMIKHWIRRQAAGLVPFRFKKAIKTIGKNKHAAEANGTGTDVESAEDTEEDLTDDEGSQTQEDAPSQGDGSINCSTEQGHPAQSPGDAAEDQNEVSWFPKHGE